jgi:putative colanic acid biosynthesis acetyltransferase WcaF
MSLLVPPVADTGLTLMNKNPFHSPHSLGNRMARQAWQVIWVLLFRPTPKILHSWRRLLLRLFGAKLGRDCIVHPSTKVWAPWNLEMGDYAGLGPYVDCYNVAKVTLGDFCIVSQYSYLCSASHDYTRMNLPLLSKPIRLGHRVWVGSDAFIGHGVTVGDGVVVGARSSVFRDVEPWTVVAGSPARLIKMRILEDESVAAP